MLSKSQISFVNALHHKKYRKEHNLFIAEGTKLITEFLASDYSIDTVFCISASLSKLGKLPQKVKLFEVTEAELKKISTLTNPQDALALIKIPEETNVSAESFKGKFTLILDGVQDPGNLGTIIRTADWFGFSELVCSVDSVEAYNPKVVQATMGSLARVKVYYQDLKKLLQPTKLPLWGALLDGSNIYETDFGNEGIVILGNEGKGISTEVKDLITAAVTIPRFGGAESLNVGVSAAIFCSEIKRNSTKMFGRKE
ncbi:RNA methyltransferase [Pedobacter sp. SYSU D00535]|uniref:TrmH family RNA methyltransferase n=1 Tax=Pedobacter sp. SYSU D00535 TaxID=2810308 RepID=UPI001A957ECF|nr:TrmH family RNA methyltransferase [Pedobacter sp. SYSU D00535]